MCNSGWFATSHGKCVNNNCNGVWNSATDPIKILGEYCDGHGDSNCNYTDCTCYTDFYSNKVANDGTCWPCSRTGTGNWDYATYSAFGLTCDLSTDTNCTLSTCQCNSGYYYNPSLDDGSCWSCSGDGSGTWNTARYNAFSQTCDSTDTNCDQTTCLCAANYYTNTQLLDGTCWPCSGNGTGTWNQALYTSVTWGLECDVSTDPYCTLATCLCASGYYVNTKLNDGTCWPCTGVGSGTWTSAIYTPFGLTCEEDVFCDYATCLCSAGYHSPTGAPGRCVNDDCNGVYDSADSAASNICDAGTHCSPLCQCSTSPFVFTDGVGGCNACGDGVINDTPESCDTGLVPSSGCLKCVIQPGYICAPKKGTTAPQVCICAAQNWTVNSAGDCVKAVASC